jgi:dienelactone hydrolase
MWFRNLCDYLAATPPRNPAGRARRAASRRRPAAARLRLEALEDRCLLSAVHALFDLGSPASGAFPTDRFTVADTTQNTGRLVNLPLPDPATHPSDYQDTQVLNTLDGFNLQPRLSVPFDGAIDVNTVNSSDVFLISLGNTLDPEDHGGQVVGINQIVWDTFTNTLHVQSDELLDQHTRYALIVTNGIQDTQDDPVGATDAFRHFRHDLAQSDDPVLRFYRRELIDALHAVRDIGVPERDIVTASVFTTESATSVLEKIRDQIHAATPAPADFNLGTNGERTVFARADVTGITFHEQTKVDPPDFTNVPLTANLTALNYIPGAVSEIAFGKYISPDYEVHPGEYIPPVGTLTGTPEVQGYNEIYFNLFLPSGQMPEGGWPVAIYGHENAGSKNDSYLIAATLAEHGIATIAISAVGHDFGPLGTLTVSQTDGSHVTFSAGGRGRDQDGDHTIDANEGISATAPRNLLFFSDGIRQTAVDLMQLVRVIEVGVDVHGDGQTDLDPSRIYYVGHSLGGNYGTVFLAVEPDVRAGVLSAPGDPFANRLLNAGRGGLGALLLSRTPLLVNSPGIKVLGGLNENAPYFDENMPLRDGAPLTVTLADGTTGTIQSPVTNTVPGAMAIQEVLDNSIWASQAGDPVAYAPHLRKAPLPGVPGKSVIYQFNKGDQSAPNPNTTAVIRAGGLADRTSYYRHDLAYAADPTIPKNPHTFIRTPTSTNPLVAKVAQAKQRQIAEFFASDGQFIDDLADVTTPAGKPLFETPIEGSLPEDLNYIPPDPPRGSPAPMSSSSVYGPAPTNPAGGSLPMPSLFSPLELGGQQGAPDATPSGPPPQEVPSGPQVASADGLFASLYQEKPKRIAPRSKGAVPGEPNSMINEVVLEKAGLLV